MSSSKFHMSSSKFHQNFTKFHEKLSKTGFFQKIDKTKGWVAINFRKPENTKFCQNFTKFPKFHEKSTPPQILDFSPPFDFLAVFDENSCLTPPVQTKKGKLKRVFATMGYVEGASDDFWGSRSQKTPAKNGPEKLP